MADRRRRLFLRLLGNGIAQGALAFASAWTVRTLVDRFLRDGNTAMHGLAELGLLLLAIGAGLAWLRWREVVDAERLGQDRAFELREAMLDHISRLPPHVLGKRRRGGLFLRFVGDLTAIRNWISLGLARLSVAGIMLIVSLGLLASVDLYLALIVVFIVVLGALVTLVVGRDVNGAVRATRRARGRLAADIGETLAGLVTLQVFAQRRRRLRHLARQAQRVRAASINQASRTGVLQAMSMLTAAWAGSGVLLFGIWTVGSGLTSVGAVVGAMSVVGILLGPLRNLGKVYAYRQAARVAQEKIDTVLRLGPSLRSARDAADLVGGPGALEFQAVTVGGRLGPLSASVPGGCKLLLRGPNGAGKSTVLALVGRLREPDAGRILIDGQALQDVRLTALRKAIGWVDPDMYLFRGTVESNLRLASAKASSATQARACRDSGLDELLQRLPQGLSTPVQEGGRNFSAGERLRILLARALLVDPRLLLLDEADANLDAESEALLYDLVDRFRGTVLMVSHRPSAVAHADVVWHLDGGLLSRVEPGGRAPMPGASVIDFGGRR